MKMNLNDIKIGNRTYSIIAIDDESFDVILTSKGIDCVKEIKSFVDYDEQFIAVRGSLKNDHKRELVVHECLHACLEDSGVEQDENHEQFIKIMSPRLSCLLTKQFINLIEKI